MKERYAPNGFLAGEDGVLGVTRAGQILRTAGGFFGNLLTNVSSGQGQGQNQGTGNTQMQAQPQSSGNNNTLIYVGVGAAVLIGIFVLAPKKKGKKK